MENPLEDFKFIKEGALRGDIELQFIVAQIYREGIVGKTPETSIPPDIEEAKRFYLLAAKQNHPMSWAHLGMYFSQEVLAQEGLSQFIAFKNGADLGEVNCQFNVGIIYSSLSKVGGNTHSLPDDHKDFFQSLKYLALAAQKNYSRCWQSDLVSDVMNEVNKMPISNLEELNIIIIALHGIIQNNDLKSAPNSMLNVQEKQEFVELMGQLHDKCKVEYAARIKYCLENKQNISEIKGEFSKLKPVKEFLDQCGYKAASPQMEKFTSPSSEPKPQEFTNIQTNSENKGVTMELPS